MIRLWMLLGCVPFLHASVDFSKDVAPLLETRCQMCHGAKQQMSGLRLDQPDSALRVITPGSSAASKLIERVSSSKPGFRMPPVGAPLTEKEVAALKAWIDEGAKFPAAYNPGAAKLEHWSFLPIGHSAPPTVKNAAWVRNPIDAFVLAKLESQGITPSPEAPKLTLLRRVTLDLTGLPPTPEEVGAFLADTRPDAYERVVDRLLQSRHYGERWARPWLDLAHYADSDGYEKDQVRPFAWRYRNWVINALNNDMPFTEFTIDQLAGDLLPHPTTAQLVATGFLRNTLTNREAGVDRAEARYEQLVNRVNTMSTTWLGLTVGCAQCHDHKYDPITNKEFYQFYAFFDAADETTIEAPLAGERERYEAALPHYLGQRGNILDYYNVPELQKEWENKLRFAIANPGKNLEWDFSITSMRAMVDGAEKLLKTDPSKRSPRDQRRLTDYFLSTPGPDIGHQPEIRDRLREAYGKIMALEAELPPLTLAMAIEPEPDYHGSITRIKGDYKAMGVPVQPGGLHILPPLPGNGKPTRLELAQSLVAPNNPLTPRVTVNRAWQELFGRGIVRTSEDFGTTGEKPSHPQLLDWLATRFIEDGWSMKKLHRLIVTSATYRQSSDTRPELLSKDPDNSLLARQTRLRLPAELIRDATLSASGLLDARIGGPSVMPPQPAGVAELGYGGSKWKESKGSDRYRRGLYIHFQRTTPYPQLINFDAPDSNVACSRRRASNTPLQSLNLLNDPVFFEAAQSLAARVLRARRGSFAERLDYAFDLTLGRKADAKERERLARYYDQQLGILDREGYTIAKLAPSDSGLDQRELAAWVGVSRVLLNLDEFITKE